MKESKANTERSDCKFTVKEYSEGTPWIIVEESGAGLPTLGEGFIGFDLPKGTKYDRAAEIADYLSKNIVSIGITKFS